MTMKQRLIFIGGASASGKTTLAKKLGKHLGLPWLSVDYIHDMARSIGNKEATPEALAIREETAEEFYDNRTTADVVQSEITISHEMWPAIKSLVDAGYEGVIEGVAVIPELVHSLETDAEVTTLYITNEDAGAILRIAIERGIWDAAHMYPDTVKPREVEFALGYNQYLKEEAKKYGYPLVPVKRTDDDLEQVLQVLYSD